MPNLTNGDIRWKTEYCGRFAHLPRRVYNLRETALRVYLILLKAFDFLSSAFFVQRRTPDMGGRNLSVSYNTYGELRISFIQTFCRSEGARPI